MPLSRPVRAAAALAVLATLAAAMAPALAAPAPLRASTGEWTIDRAASRVSFTLAGAGGPVQGVFKRWTAQVAFDPARPASGHVSVSAEAASLVTGDPARDQALAGPEALGAAHARHVAFTSRTIRPRPDGGFDVAGVLALRGASQPATAVMRFVRDPRAHRLDLEVALPPEAFAAPGRPRPASASLAVRLAARDP